MSALEVLALLELVVFVLAGSIIIGAVWRWSRRHLDTEAAAERAASDARIRRELSRSPVEPRTTPVRSHSADHRNNDV